MRSRDEGMVINTRVKRRWGAWLRYRIIGLCDRTLVELSYRRSGRNCAAEEDKLRQFTSSFQSVVSGTGKSMTGGSGSGTFPESPVPDSPPGVF